MPVGLAPIFACGCVGPLKNTFLTSLPILEWRTTDTIVLEKDGPKLEIDRETPETILMNHSKFQLVQRAIEDLPLHHARPSAFVKW